jgi:hypothetical protein
MIQKKNTKIKAVTSSNSRKADPLDKYRAQAAPIIAMMFDEGTPHFIQGFLHEWTDALQTATRVFPAARRDVADFLLPLMLQAADKQNLDVESQRSPFIYRLLAGFADDGKELHEAKKRSEAECKR